jgi:galactokinase
VSVPGRVNLLGDHIDYLGLSVLPMALERGITAAARSRDDRDVRVTSTLTGASPRQFECAAAIPPYEAGDWGNYAKAAAQWVAATHAGARGADIVITSDLPAAMGLSSSTAVVVAIALALLAVNGITIEPSALVEELADAERYVGTRGGAMDHAACLLSRSRAALRVDFEPVQVEPVTIPAEWRFIVASSLVPAAKSDEARERYNARRREAEAALRAVAPVFGLDPMTATYPALLARHRPVDILDRGERWLSLEQRFRFRHVITEATRVGWAESALRAERRDVFARQMRQSHRSLRDWYRVSCFELDELVATAEAGGAEGARLTGAGFGGSAVFLCAPDAVNLLLATVDEFYRGFGRETDFSEVRFVAEAGEGASVASV